MAGVLVTVAVLRPGGEHWARGFSDFLSSPTALIAGIATLACALRVRGPDRASWLLIGAGALSWGLGELIWVWSERVLHQVAPFPSVADAAYLAMIPLLVAGLATLPAREVPPRRARSGLDALLFAAAVLNISWFAVLGPAYAEADAGLSEQVVALAYPAGDVLLAFALAGAVARGWGQARDPMVLALLAGIAVLLVADFAFAYVTLRDLYSPGHPVDYAWPLGLLCIAYAAARRAAAPRDRWSGVARPRVRRTEAGYSALPGALVLGVTIILFYERLSGPSEHSLLVGLPLLAGVWFIVRQHLQLAENARLRTRLLQRSQDLEGVIEERTAGVRALAELQARLTHRAATEPPVVLAADAAAVGLEVLGADLSSVFALDDDAERLTRLAGSGWPEGDDEMLRMGTGPRSAPGRALALRAPVVSSSNDPSLVEPPSYGRLGIVSSLHVPVGSTARPYGVLSLHYRRPARLVAQDVELAEALAATLGQALQRSQAGAALREEHAKTERLLAAVPSFLVRVGPEWLIREWNDAATVVFGVPASAVLGRPFHDCPFGWDWQPVDEAIADSLRDREAVHLDEVRCLTGDGREVFVSLVAGPLSGTDDAPMGVLLVGTDTSERRALQLQIAGSQRLAAIGRLASGVADELNTPAQYVGDNLRFLQTAFAHLTEAAASFRRMFRRDAAGAAMIPAEEQPDPDEIRYLIAEIPTALDETLEGIDRIARIGRTVIEFARTGEEERVAADVNVVVTSTAGFARGEWQHLATLQLELAGDLPVVPCDPGDLNQALLSLITNGAQAIAEAPGDGLRPPGRIAITTRREGDGVAISVRDNGVGVPAAIAARVFEPFVTSRPPGQGRGQGLAMARSAIERHAGRLTLESRPGEGATFTIWLPLGDPASIEAGRAAVA